MIQFQAWSKPELGTASLSLFIVIIEVNILDVILCWGYGGGVANRFSCQTQVSWVELRFCFGCDNSVKKEFFGDDLC